MISQTLPGKLKKSRAISINWCGTDPYALVRSSHTTWSSVLFLLEDSMEFHIFVHASDNQGSLVSQPSGQMYLYSSFFYKEVCHTTSKDTKNCFSFNIKEGYGRKLEIPFKFISLEIQIPSAKHHSCGTIHMYLWVCFYVYLHVHIDSRCVIIYVRVNIHVCIFYIYLFMFNYVFGLYIQICVHIYINIYVSIWTFICVSIYMLTCVRTCVCERESAFKYIHLYIYKYVYLFIGIHVLIYYKK